MKKIIPYIAFFCFTGLTATNGLSVLAAGCNSHINKKAKIECEKEDAKCQDEKSVNYELDKMVKS